MVVENIPLIADKKMIGVKLKRLLARQEVRQVVNDLVEHLDAPIIIQDKTGKLIFGTELVPYEDKYPITLGEQLLGWVMGGKQGLALANLLSYLARAEQDRKELGKETLAKYKELNLIYKISEKFSANLELKEIAKLVLAEAVKIIKATSGSVCLLNQATRQLDVIATIGVEVDYQVSLHLGEGIAGYVTQTGKAEIVNDVSADARYLPNHHRQVNSLICAPLNTTERPLGAIVLSSSQTTQYTAADLKLLNALASQAGVAMENAILHENKLREERIKSNLERYVASQVVQAILELKGEISLEPSKRNVSILFSDIRNFTGKCEELAPEEIVGYLNEYFTHMVDVIFQHQGTVNKFVGDMIVAFFGAPSVIEDTERKAIATAIAMQKRISDIPVAWIRDNFPTGIGISSGKVVVGNIGSPKHMDYTAIGDEVNIASRLQSIAKGGQILVTRRVYEAAKNSFSFQDFGIIKVKGKKKTIEVFEVIY